MNYLKTILACTYPQEAHMAKGLLQSEGIETFIQDELTAQVYSFASNALGGIKVQVKGSDFEKALMVLKEGGYIKEGNKRDEEKIEILKIDKATDKTICPFCQSHNIGKKREVSILTVIVYFVLGFIFPIFRRSYTCFDCHKIWKYNR